MNNASHPDLDSSAGQHEETAAVQLEACHPAAEAYAKRHEMDVILSGSVDHDTGAAIDKMTDEEVSDELKRRGIDADLSYWKHRCHIFEVLNRAADGDLRDQMEITGRKEMELVKLRGEIKRLEEVIANQQNNI